MLQCVNAVYFPLPPKTDGQEITKVEIEATHRVEMIFRAGFGRYLAALEIIRQSPGTDLKGKSAATVTKF